MLGLLPPPEEPTDAIGRIHASAECIMGVGLRLDPSPPPELTVIRGEGEDDDA